VRTQLVVILLLGFQTVFGQYYPKGDNFKLGIKTGAAFTRLNGGVLVNPAVKYGFTGGIFYRRPVGDLFHFQAETNAGFRGGNFRNGDDEYYKLSTFYIEVPVLWMVDLKKGSDDWAVFAGAQASYLANATIYVEPNVIPQREQPSLNPMDYMAVVGIQRNTYYAGIQLALKWGLTDINDNIAFDDFGPEPQSGEIRNFGIELSVYF
jgi:hypothetical protein